jgi:hypothetical protein
MRPKYVLSAPATFEILVPQSGGLTCVFCMSSTSEWWPRSNVAAITVEGAPRSKHRSSSDGPQQQSRRPGVEEHCSSDRPTRACVPRRRCLLLRPLVMPKPSLGRLLLHAMQAAPGNIRHYRQDDEIRWASGRSCSPCSSPSLRCLRFCCPKRFLAVEVWLLHNSLAKYAWMVDPRGVNKRPWTSDFIFFTQISPLLALALP